MNAKCYLWSLSRKTESQLVNEVRPTKKKKSKEKREGGGVIASACDVRVRASG